MRHTSIVLCLAALLAGCAPRHLTVLPASPALPTTAGPTASLTISITIPRGPQTSGLSRRAQYISTATNSLVLTPQGQTPIVMPLTVNTPGCRTLSGARICTFTASLPVGTYSLGVALYATADGTGTPLAMVTNLQTIVQNTTNNLSFTLNAVVSTINVSLVPDGTFSVGTAATRTINVAAVDAAAATIVVGTDSLVDSNGSAVTIRLANTDTSGATSISPQTAGATPSTLSYNGAASSGGTVTATAVNASNLAVSSAHTNFAVASGPVCSASARTMSGADRRPDTPTSCSLPVPVPTPFMSPPLTSCGRTNPDGSCRVDYRQWGMYSLNIINSVLDHHMTRSSPTAKWQYGSLYDGEGDGIVTAFDGSTVGDGLKAHVDLLPNTTNAYAVCGTLHLYGAQGDMINQPTAGESLPNCGTSYASYDEHPGYDYVAQYHTEVKAVAAGFVVGYRNQSCIPTFGGIDPCSSWGFIGIDHLNGYVSQYGHMDPLPLVPGSPAPPALNPGEPIYAGQPIGLSSSRHVGGKENSHLHFEVLVRVINDQDPNEYYNPKYWAVVDPYGWTVPLVLANPPSDPLYSSTRYGVKPTRLWK